MLLVGNDFCDFIENSTGSSVKIIVGFVVIAIIAYVIRSVNYRNKQLNESVRIEKKDAKKLIQKNLKLFTTKMVS